MKNNIEDMESKIKISGLKYEQDVMTRNFIKYVREGFRFRKLEFEQNTPARIHPSKFSIKPCDEETKIYLEYKHKQLYNLNESYEPFNIKCDGYNIYNVILKEFKNDEWLCCCDWFEKV